MTKYLAVTAVFLAACSDPPPECAATATPYDICADASIWTCTGGSSEDVAFNEAVNADCEASDDLFGCALAAEYRMVEMTLREDCRASGKTCIEDGSQGPGTNTCVD